MSDHSLAVRKAVVKALLADDVIRGYVAKRVYGERVEKTPSSPFLRYFPVTVEKWEDNCGEGVEITANVHVFDTYESSDRTYILAAEVKRVVENLDMDTLRLIESTWVRTQLVPTQETKDYHAVVSFVIIAAD